MSDVLYSSTRRPPGELAAGIRGIYQADAPELWEYHGPWGSLAVSRGHYTGFSPVETDDRICAVMGGPVLRFRDNSFLTGQDDRAGTRAILERLTAGAMDWAEDLSGPFAVVVINRAAGEIRCVTDLLLSIPVYRHSGPGGLVLGTHVDAVAKVCGRGSRFDEVSLVDFVLHHVVTYPQTAYDGVVQCEPATDCRYLPGRSETGQATHTYWVPEESTPFRKLGEAAEALRDGVRDHVERITGSMTRVAQFLSAGEDTRALAGLLPAGLQRDGYTFLDSMNREGRIAARVAAAYGVRLEIRLRDLPDHYLDILEEASDLVGLGHAYRHAHAVGFHRACGLDRYRAVFGGYSGDALLKGHHARLLLEVRNLPLLPQVPVRGEARSRPVTTPVFAAGVLSRVVERRREHVARVAAFRPESAHEWFALWPMTMRPAGSLFFSNRRLFAAYEPFLSAEAIRIGAAAPLEWKLNRRLFRTAFRPELGRGRWIRAGDGRLPYWPWWANLPLQLPPLLRDKWAERFPSPGGNQGPWTDWNRIAGSRAWDDAAAVAERELEAAGALPFAVPIGTALRSNLLPVRARTNLLQVGHACR